MSDCIKISTSSENYLEAIFHLSQGGNPVRSVDVAERIGVSKASVNKAISVLRQAGMVEQELYGTIILTPLGSSRAKEVVASARRSQTRTPAGSSMSSARRPSPA